jgi:putative transcriptional regulator
MSLRKLCFVATLATILAFAAVGRSDVPIQGFDPPAPNSSLSDRAFASHEPLRSLGQPANQPSRAQVWRAASEVPPAVFTPVQSSKVNDLGAGKLLVASRDLGDPNFARTVILLIHYDEDGVLGLILNRRTEVPLSRVLDGLEGAKDRSDPVYLGGPVETPAVTALLRSPRKLEGAEHIFGVVYLISSKTLFERTISARPDPATLHVYLGYAGWDQDQLRREVEVGSWFIFPADAGTVFNADPDSLWPQMIQKTELKLAGL